MIVHGGKRLDGDRSGAGHRLPGRPLSSGTTPPAAVHEPTSSAKSKKKDKDRSRSKSPFRSFRWKKSSSGSPKSPSVPHSDDESSFSEHQSPAAEEEPMEGVLTRKHECEAGAKKASNRSWDKVYVVMKGPQLLFYKDLKSYKAAPDVYLKNEQRLDLKGGMVEVALDYTKKRHVFRVKTSNGAEILFQAKDDEEMHQWVSAIGAQCEGGSGPSKSQTLPARPGQTEQKKRGFFTLKKN